MPRFLYPALFLAMALCAAAAEEPARQGLEFSGSLYADLGAYHYVNKGAKDSAAFSATTVLAARFRNVNRKSAKVEGDAELILPYGAAAGQYAAALRSAGADSLTAAVERTVSRYIELFSMGKAPFLLDLRKLFLEVYLPLADISVGRQIINFGKGTLFSPIDAFSSVQLGDLNLRRTGSDVASVRVPIGGLAGVDCIVEAPFWNNEHSSAVKAFATLAGWDINLVGIYRHKSREAITGAAFKGDAVVGLYGELVGHFLDGRGDRYLEAMLGADYSIRNIWFFNTEYYYQGRQTNPLSPWGRNNAYASIQYAPTELTRLSLIAIHQFEERRTIGMLSWYYSLLQNADLTVYLRGYDNLPGLATPDLQYAARIEVKF
jgi:hypothetical protein